MDFIWNENYPIAIHVTDPQFTTRESLQELADHYDLPVRHLSTNEDFYPQ
jgi:hypothetical protein